MPKVMKPITKSISYGYDKSVQLFIEDGLEPNSKFFIIVLTKYGQDGEVCCLTEYRYDDYLKAVHHMHKIVINFFYNDLF